MIACPQCGKLNPENFNYCLDCGAELHPETTHSAESQFFIDLSADSPEVKKAREDAEKVKDAENSMAPGIQIEDNSPPDFLIDNAPVESGSEFKDEAIAPESEVASSNEVPALELEGEDEDDFSLDSLDESVEELVAESVSEEIETEEIKTEAVSASEKVAKPGNMILELSPDDLEDALEVPVIDKGLAVKIGKIESARVKTENVPNAGELLSDISLDSVDDFDGDLFQDEAVELDSEPVPVVEAVEVAELEEIEEIEAVEAMPAEPLFDDKPDSSLGDTIGFADEAEELHDDIGNLKIDLSASDPNIDDSTLGFGEEPDPFSNDIELAIDDSNEQDLSIDMGQNEEMSCSKCGAALKPADRFCGQCGTPTNQSPVEEDGGRTMFMHVGDEAALGEKFVGKLIVQEPSGREGRSFDLAEGENLCGRTTDPVLLDDTYVSPTHCSFIYTDGQMTVKDHKSLNGVFIKLKGEMELASKTSFRIGQQLLVFVALDDFDSTAEAIASDDTRFLGSPAGNIWGKLLHINNDGRIMASYILKESKIVIGRENGDITFANDGFVSGTHASIRLKDGKCYLKDLGSSNGSFVKVNDYNLKDNDLVLIGKKLMRYEVAG